MAISAPCARVHVLVRMLHVAKVAHEQKRSTVPNMRSVGRAAALKILRYCSQGPSCSSQVHSATHTSKEYFRLG